jgi:Ca2+-transporting ATPase
MDTLTLHQNVDGYHKQAALTGLSAEQVMERRFQFGKNRLPSEKGVSVWTVLLNQVKSPLVYIILAAAAISLALGELGDFAIIMAVVVIDVILGFVQEYQAQQTYESLKGLLKPTTTVIRDGQRLEVEVWELVPGDLVVLNAGEKAPGDGELVEATRLSLDEAILTGECEPVNKQAVCWMEGGPADIVSNPENQVFMGTTVVTGRGILRITKTRTNTELGKIAASLSEHVEEETPLQVRLKTFSKVLTYMVVAATLVILVVVLGFLTVFVAFIIPGIRNLLGIVPQTLQEWSWVFGISLTLLIFVEIGKAVSNRIHPHD